MRPAPIGASSAIIAVIVSILWGGNVVSIRAGVDSVPPLWSAFWRMLTGVVFVAGWAYWRGVPLKPSRNEYLPLLALGVLFTVQIGLLNTASAMTSPAYGVVILNSYPIFANIAGHFGRGFAVHEEPITGIRALGLILALAGVAVLAFGKPDTGLAPQPLLGNVLMVISSFLLGVRQVYTRWLVQNIDPARSIVWQMALSVPLFLVIAWASEPMLLKPLSAEAVSAILYQGVIVAGICFIVWAELLKKHAAGTLTMFSFIVPICGIALSSLMFREALAPGLFTGTALVLAGVLVVVRLGQSTRDSAA
jgi:O-acetylserine/cysteine efflux transporter